MPFVKLDCKILDKSIWDESSDTRIVWITMLAMADSDGIVEAAITGIAKKANVPIKETEKAIKKFESPDKYSTNPDHEGRRILRIKEGFKILNHGIYREKDYTAAARMRKHREKLRVTGVTSYASTSVSESESKKCKLEDKIKEKIEALKKAWYDQIQYYMVKYPILHTLILLCQMPVVKTYFYFLSAPPPSPAGPANRRTGAGIPRNSRRPGSRNPSAKACHRRPGRIHAATREVGARPSRSSSLLRAGSNRNGSQARRPVFPTGT